MSKSDELKWVDDVVILLKNGELSVAQRLFDKNTAEIQGEEKVWADDLWADLKRDYYKEPKVVNNTEVEETFIPVGNPIPNISERFSFYKEKYNLFFALGLLVIGISVLYYPSFKEAFSQKSVVEIDGLGADILLDASDGWVDTKVITDGEHSYFIEIENGAVCLVRLGNSQVKIVGFDILLTNTLESKFLNFLPV